MPKRNDKVQPLLAPTTAVQTQCCQLQQLMLVESLAEQKVYENPRILQ
jgi:hypothetical protein